MIYHLDRGDVNEHNFAIRLTAIPGTFGWSVTINVVECGGEYHGKQATLAGAISDALNSCADKIAGVVARDITSLARLAHDFSTQEPDDARR